MSSIVHIAGSDVTVGAQLRQRCAWCGAVLADYLLDRIMYEVSTPPEERKPATWPVGALVEIDGGVSWVVEHEDGDPLPVNACGNLAAEVTV